MLTLETLYAVLQGLPLEYLHHLDNGLQAFCYQLRVALDQGQPPLEAFRSTVTGAIFGVRSALVRMLGHMIAVAQIPGLSHRQRQALIALRYSKSISLVKLSLVLQQDRSNLHKCMEVLVRKGHALKFLQPRGAVYIPIVASLDHATKVSINHFIAELMKSQPEELANITKTTKLTTTT